MSQPTKTQQYQRLIDQIEQLLDGERDFVVNAALASSLVYFNLPQILWAGFYLRREDELILGPFQGRPASIRVPFGQGLCGVAAARRETLVIPDLRALDTDAPEALGSSSPETIAQIVTPLVSGTYVLGVLQLDSPKAGRFDDDDRNGLERVARVFINLTEFPE
jgi:GAF domain-containing protein